MSCPDNKLPARNWIRFNINRFHRLFSINLCRCSPQLVLQSIRVGDLYTQGLELDLHFSDLRFSDQVFSDQSWICCSPIKFSQIRFGSAVLGSAVLSARNQNNRKKMIAPATLGRKPLVVLHHEMAVEKNLRCDSEVARSDAYLKCHTKKDEILLCSSIASNIKKIEQADPSSRVLSINDSLTQAVGKDKGGSMRGLSGCLSRTLLKKATPLVEKKKSLEAEKIIMTNEVMELKENYKHVTQVITELKETVMAKQGDNKLSTRKSSFPSVEHHNIVGKQCTLYGWARRLIAHGLIQSVDPNLIIHRKTVGSGNLNIALTKVVDPTCQLWLRDGFHESISEVGVGGFVVRPEHSVEVMNE